ncbi:MAG: hypothetical protein PUB42_04830 [Firmicutes bacterium]|nr:hypothetical protein [Bacillota bacterium]
MLKKEARENFEMYLNKLRIRKFEVGTLRELEPKPHLWIYA